MKLARWMAAAMMAGSQAALAAVCVSGPARLGTLEPAVAPDPSASFGAVCTAYGARPDNPADWSFTNRYRFTLSQAASQVFGHIDLNYTRAYQVFPNSPNPGQTFFEITTSAIWFEHAGTRTIVGDEGAGHNEQASLFAFDLGAGDYVMEIQGRVFNTPTRTGFYDGYLNVVYAGETVARSLSLQQVAAPVPEPATVAMLLLAVPAVAGVAARRRRAAANAAR